MALNRDVLVAIALLVITGGLMVASFDIREPNYGQLSPAAWPRAILVTMLALSLIYLIQSLRAGPQDTQRPADLAPGFRGFISYWRNVIWVFVLFLGYLLVIPYVGMLVGGVAFVFLLLTVLGGLRAAPLHLAIAVVTMGGVWSLFTFALDVFLPRGAWTGF